MTDDRLIELANNYINTLPRLMRALGSLDADDPAMELPVAQLRVCAILMDGPHSMSALSKELGVSLSAMTQIADRLERHGLVERTSEAEDRRVRSLQLTGHGQEVMQKRKAKRLQRAIRILEALTPEGREEADKILASLWIVSCMTSDNPAPMSVGQLELM